MHVLCGILAWPNFYYCQRILNVYKNCCSQPFHIQSLSRTGLERLVNRCDMITQSMFREIKNPKSLHFCYHLLKCHTAKWYCSLHTHINFHSSKLHVVEGILYHTAFPTNSSSNAWCIFMFYFRVADCCTDMRTIYVLLCVSYCLLLL